MSKQKLKNERKEKLKLWKDLVEYLLKENISITAILGLSFLLRKSLNSKAFFSRVVRYKLVNSLYRMNFSEVKQPPDMLPERFKGA